MPETVTTPEEKIHMLQEVVNDLSFSAPEIRARKGTYLYNKLCDILEMD